MGRFQDGGDGGARGADAARAQRVKKGLSTKAKSAKRTIGTESKVQARAAKREKADYKAKAKGSPRNANEVRNLAKSLYSGIDKSSSKPNYKFEWDKLDNLSMDNPMAQMVSMGASSWKNGMPKAAKDINSGMKNSIADPTTWGERAVDGFGGFNETLHADTFDMGDEGEVDVNVGNLAAKLGLISSLYGAKGLMGGAGKVGGFIKPRNAPQMARVVTDDVAMAPGAYSPQAQQSLWGSGGWAG